MTDWKSKSAIAHSEANVVRFSQERIHRQSGTSIKLSMDLSDLYNVIKLSDTTCTCLAIDPRPDILLTQSARSVNFLKRATYFSFGYKIKRNFCDHVSINKLTVIK